MKTDRIQKTVCGILQRELMKAMEKNNINR